jgi:hypothetical protein
MALKCRSDQGGEAMNEQSDLLKRLVAKLAETGVPFMIVGSVAASYHGHPRSTLDIDAAVDADEETLCRFAGSLGEGYYVSKESVREAARSRTAFNVIDDASGYKAVLIVRKERPFSRMEFRRRIRIDAMGITLEMATAEDVILSKLEWAKLGSSERSVLLWEDSPPGGCYFRCGSSPGNRAGGFAIP